MGKNKGEKQVAAAAGAKEKTKFNRNVEISAPILDPEIIKAIHSPPGRGGLAAGQRLDLKHGGFKQLLSDLNQQDSTDDTIMSMNENHVPSYIGISCAVSGYSNYSSYSKRAASPLGIRSGENIRSRTTSPTANYRNNTKPAIEHHQQQHVHHITIDKNNIQSPDEERKELTEKLIASAAEHRRSPSPIPPTEDDRHHGAYVGARYCPLPAPDKVNRHIPLLGIDDDQNPDDIIRDEEAKNKVEQKIANLYGDEFVDGWRESMTHKAKKELPEDQAGHAAEPALIKNPKDLVTLKPTPPPVQKEPEVVADVPTPSAKVLAGVEKQFLNKLLTDENPPTPSPPPSYLQQSPVRESKTEPTPVVVAAETTTTRQDSPTPASSPTFKPELKQHQQAPQKPQKLPTPPPSPEHLITEEMSKVEEPMQQHSVIQETIATTTAIPSSGEEHIEYEIRAQSPVDNEASPVRIRSMPDAEETKKEESVEENLVSFTPEPTSTVETIKEEEEEPEQDQTSEQQSQVATDNKNHDESETTTTTINDGRYYLNLLDQEKSFILSQVAEAEKLLAAEESEMDEDTTGRIRSAIGKANLLVNKKCNQFKELCESNINANANEQYATLNDDLAGFWDMIRIQIEDVRKSFENIWLAKANNWQIESMPAGGRIAAGADSGSDESRESSLKQDKGSIKPKLSAQKDQERRERLKEHINQMKQNQTVKTTTNVIEDDAALIGGTVDDLEQVGCDAIETVVEATSAANEVVAQQVEEAEEQLFSLMGSTSPQPPADLVAQTGDDDAEKPKQPTENLLDLLD